MQNDGTPNINNNIGRITKIQCLNCKNLTNHAVLVNAEFNGGDDFLSWTNDYQVVKCLGCDSTSFRSTHENSDDVEEYYKPNGERYLDTVVTEEIYPRRKFGYTGLADEAFNLPRTLYRIYKETTDALNADIPVLTGIGIRAILETLCKDKGSNGTNLYQKIDDLVTQKILTENRANILHQIRALGNDAAHEVHPHNWEQLKLAMSVIDHLLQEVYLIPRKADTTFISQKPKFSLPPLPNSNPQIGQNN